MGEPAVEVLDGSEIDHGAYAAFQRDAFRDLLVRRRSSDEHVSPDFFRWKYRTPDGAGRIAAVFRDGRIVSSAAILPVRLSSARASVRGWHCVDVATLPEERRKGHFSKCLNALVASVSTGDVLFAFPNEGSLGGFLKLGFDENVVMTTWVVPRVGLVSTGAAEVAQPGATEVDRDLLEACVGSDRPHIDRRPDYLEWRYRDHPVNEYTVVSYSNGADRGFCVMRRARVMNREIALVMELFGTGSGVQTALMRHAADRARSAGVRTLVLMSTSVPLRTALGSCLIPVPSRLLPKRQVLVVRSGDRTTTPFTAATWFVQTGDWDVF